MYLVSSLHVSEQETCHQGREKSQENLWEIHWTESKDQLRGILELMQGVWENQCSFVQFQKWEGVKVLLRALLMAEACLVSAQAVEKRNSQDKFVTYIMCLVYFRRQVMLYLLNTGSNHFLSNRVN